MDHCNDAPPIAAQKSTTLTYFLTTNVEEDLLSSLLPPHSTERLVSEEDEGGRIIEGGGQRSFRLREEFFGSRPAKVFVQKISFKLRVRRLNCVELFYALVAAIGSESRRCLRGRGGHMHVVCMQRWLATARPPVGAADHGLATCIGRLAAATCGHGQLRPARKGQPVAASPTASRGGGAGRRGGRPLAGRQPPLALGQRRRRRSEGEGGSGHLFEKR
ncbi:hypothetical protein GW17_00055972 [Ensete ventricosum]|nr:hypothetical protein GW17_00055972 [Ensete ventricosum]